MWNTRVVNVGEIMGLEEPNSGAWARIIPLSWQPFDVQKALLEANRSMIGMAKEGEQMQDNEDVEEQMNFGLKSMQAAEAQFLFAVPKIVADWGGFHEEIEELDAEGNFLGTKITEIPPPAVLRRQNSMGKILRIPSPVLQLILQEAMEDSTEIPPKNGLSSNPTPSEDEPQTVPENESQASLPSPEETNQPRSSEPQNSGLSLVTSANEN